MNTTTSISISTTKSDIKRLIKFLILLILLLGLVYSIATVFYYPMNNNDNQKWENDNGKSGKHINKDHKSKIQKLYENAKKELDGLRQKPNKTKEEAKTVRKLEKKVKHLFEEMNKKGETHWKRGK